MLAEAENRAANSDGQAHKNQDIRSQKLKSLEAQVIILLNLIVDIILKSKVIFGQYVDCKNIKLQILDLKKKQENQVQLLKQKEKSEEAAERLQAEIHYIKAQKVTFLSFIVFHST